MEEPSNGQIIITWEDPRSAVAEAYRILRTNLQFASPDGAYSRSHGVPYVPFPTAGRSFPCTNSARRIQALLKAVNFAGSMSYVIWSKMLLWGYFEDSHLVSRGLPERQ